MKRPPVDVSVIIAHRGPDLGLWLTVESCHEDLKNSGLTYEFIVVSNGDEQTQELKRMKHWTQVSGHYGDFIHSKEPLAPPYARHIGTWSAVGRYLFFLDNHCLLEHGYFKRAIESMQKYNIGVLHSTTRYFTGEKPHYEYELALKKNFWMEKSYDTPQDAENPYRVAMGGHGGFAVTREVWDRVEGYWMGFEGYAGEEPYFDLKCWLMDIPVWIDPQFVHKHWSGKRGYNRHFTPDYIRNLCMAANIIGGEQWMYSTAEGLMGSIQLLPKDGSKPRTMIDIVEDAYNTSIERANWVRAHSVRSLDELLDYFKAEGIRT